MSSSLRTTKNGAEGGTAIDKTHPHQTGRRKEQQAWWHMVGFRFGQEVKTVLSLEDGGSGSWA